MNHRWNQILVLGVLLLLLLAPAADASVRVVRAVDGETAWPWVRVECLEATGGAYVDEPFHEKGVQSHTQIRQLFATATPHSRQVLLHYAAGWSQGKRKTPVLLVHGAGDNACRGWCHPYSFDLPAGQCIEKPGLMQFLVAQGHPVFALTFSHPHGDNFLQAAQLAHVIERIKQVLDGGADFQLDIFCHSKGAMAVRIYLSDLGTEYPQYRWIPRFRGDVRRVIFAASPLKGIDTSFRYYAYNLTVKMKDMAAPLGPNRLTYLGMYTDSTDHNACFPGQPQMLHNWVKDGIGFSFQSCTTDMNASMLALYHGGMTALLASGGIDQAIRDGGSVIDALNRKGLDPRVEAYVLAGTKQTIDTVQLGWLSIPIGEFAAPSDGVAFVASTTYVDGLKARGARVVEVKTLPTHHVGVTVLPAALDWIDGVLTR